MDLYREFSSLRLDRPAGGVLRVTLAEPAVGLAAHAELGALWPVVERDEETRAVLFRGAEKDFAAGGSAEMFQGLRNDYAVRTRVMGEARDLVHNLVKLTKPVVAAIHGRASGAPLAVALLADVSVAGRTASIIDRHTQLGVAAGDHAVICWPLHVGMAKAKYHLLTGEPLSGEEAERIGLVSLCVDDDAVHDRSLRIAESLAAGPPTAIRWTKQTLNSWYQAMGPAFDASLALEFYGFSGPEIREVQANQSKKD